jgi:hypothetical protein
MAVATKDGEGRGQQRAGAMVEGVLWKRFSERFFFKKMRRNL